ncbi:MAG: ArsR/SmtB family transcription factor, partial [Candidatus Methanofastidiosia archaeon]
VSHHLRKLRVNGILKVRVEGQKRIYSIADPEILEILERCARTVERIAELPLGEVGKKRVERELGELQPQREEEFLELVKKFEREFTLLYGKTIGKRIAEEMRKVVRKNLKVSPKSF